MIMIERINDKTEGTMKNKNRSNSKQGANNPNSRLKAETVKMLKRLVAKYGHKRGYKAALAVKYKVSQGTLADLVSGRRWGHISLT